MAVIEATPIYLTYTFGAKGSFVPAVQHDDRTNAVSGKFRLGEVKRHDFTLGDLVHFQRITADDAKLPLNELATKFPCKPGTIIMTAIKDQVQAAIDAQGPPVPPAQVTTAGDEPPKEPTKLSAFTTIKDIVQQTEKVNYRKARPNDPPSETNVEYDTRTVGWFVDLANGLSFHFGMDKPPVSWVKGARVKLSCELAPEGTK